MTEYDTNSKQGSSLVRLILDKVDEKEKPGFLLGLQGAYLLIWALFILLSIVILLQVSDQFLNLKNAVNLIQYPADFVLAVTEATIAANYLALQNGSYITQTKDLEFFQWNLRDSADLLYALQVEEYSSDNLLTNYIKQFNLQNELNVSELAFGVPVTHRQSVSQIYFSLQQAIYQLQQNTAIDIASDKRFLLSANLDILNQSAKNSLSFSFDQASSRVSSVTQLQIQSFCYGILLLIISSVLIIYLFCIYFSKVSSIARQQLAHNHSSLPL